MNGLGQITLPFGISLPNYSSSTPDQSAVISGYSSPVQVSGYQISNTAPNYDTALQEFNLLPQTLDQSQSDTNIVGNPISSYVSAGEPLAVGGAGGGLPLSSNMSSWLWLAAIVFGGFIVVEGMSR